MVVAKTLIKNNVQAGDSPGEVFRTVNGMMCESNEAHMFVTAFMGYLDIPSGKFTFVNAGHNPPLVKRAGGRYERLPVKPGFVLAVIEGMAYTHGEIELGPGDTLYLYTDGVTEALNKDNKMFGDNRLSDKLSKLPDRELREFTMAIKSEIDRFADGAEQADDITMLVLRYNGVGGLGGEGGNY
jgi:sigma-B regulation protein RsbU (phosphoserine phosphatase)